MAGDGGEVLVEDTGWGPWRLRGERARLARAEADSRKMLAAIRAAPRVGERPGATEANVSAPAESQDQLKHSRGQASVENPGEMAEVLELFHGRRPDPRAVRNFLRHPSDALKAQPAMQAQLHQLEPWLVLTADGGAGQQDREDLTAEPAAAYNDVLPVSESLAGWTAVLRVLGRSTPDSSVLEEFLRTKQEWTAWATRTLEEGDVSKVLDLYFPVVARILESPDHDSDRDSPAPLLAWVQAAKSARGVTRWPSQGR